MVQNCINCKHVSYEWYQDNTCKNLKVFKDLKIPYDGCGNSLSCRYVYNTQGLDTDKDCKYFELGFWAKVAIIKNKICKKIHDFKLSRLK